jgi:ubiquinone/menaquinone biosynthesis C-methylase UbiE
LKKGGRFLCLEFSHIETPIAPLTPILQNVYDLYSFNVIPQIGKAVADDEASYQYLVER